MGGGGGETVHLIPQSGSTTQKLRRRRALALNRFQRGSKGLPTRSDGLLSVPGPGDPLFPHRYTVSVVPLVCETRSQPGAVLKSLTPGFAGARGTLPLSCEIHRLRISGPAASSQMLLTLLEARRERKRRVASWRYHQPRAPAPGAQIRSPGASGGTGVGFKRNPSRF